MLTIVNATTVSKGSAVGRFGLTAGNPILDQGGCSPSFNLWRQCCVTDRSLRHLELIHFVPSGHSGRRSNFVSWPYGETQQVAPRGSIKTSLVTGWGWHDRICFTSRARLAMDMFPDARLHWFAHSGHFPHRDESHATAPLILDSLSPRAASALHEPEFIADNYRKTETPAKVTVSRTQ